MNQTNQLTLIDGKFLPSNAQEVLRVLVQSKINFHNLGINSGDVLFSKQRIKALEDLLEEINMITAYARVNNKKLIIKGKIDITFTD